MKVEKWGDALAVRLPASIVEALDLKEGAEIDVRVSADAALDLAKDIGPDEWIERLRKYRGVLPNDFKFDRDDANER